MRKKINLADLFIFILIAASIASCAKNPQLDTSAKKNIALILKMNYGYHWSTVKMGAETAAREFNIDLDYASPNEEDDINAQIKMINEKLDNKDKKIDALVLAACDFEALVKTVERAYDMGIPVVIIDSQVDTDKITCNVASDNIDAGRKAGSMLVSIAGKTCNVAIINNIKGSKDAEERERGLLNVLAKYPGIRIVGNQYCYSDTRIAYSITKSLLLQNKNIDAVVALNEVAAEGAAQAVDEMKLGGRIKIIAFDSTVQEINYLEKGIIQALVIQNPFSMGYLGVKYACDVLDGKDVKKQYPIESKVIDKDTMYLPENQKLLFPFIK